MTVMVRLGLRVVNKLFGPVQPVPFNSTEPDFSNPNLLNLSSLSSLALGWSVSIRSHAATK